MKYMNAKRKAYLACAYFALRISVILTSNQGTEEFKNNDGSNKLYSIPIKVLEATRYMSTIMAEEFKFDTLYVAKDHFITDDESYKKANKFFLSLNESLCKEHEFRSACALYFSKKKLSDESEVVVFSTNYMTPKDGLKQEEADDLMFKVLKDGPDSVVIAEQI